MNKLIIPLIVLLVAIPQAASSVTRSKTKTYSKISSTGVSLTLGDPSGSVYQQNESVRFTVQTDTDAFVVVFDIDTEGYVHLLYPKDRGSLQKFSAGVAYELPADAEESLYVGGRTGMEFVFAVAVDQRDAISGREIGFLADNEKLSDERKFRVDGDPFLAANRLASQLVRGVAYNENVSLAYTYFYVNKAVDYPRYLCGDCARTGRNPYGSNHEEYLATAAFDKESRLSYPLERGFEEPSYSKSTVRSETRYDDTQQEDSSDETTRVYATYAYPSYRYYSSPLWYDPWYYGYSPYYGSGFYFNFSWGYPYGYSYYPSSYGYPYYYGYGGHHHYDYYDYGSYSGTSLKSGIKQRYKGTSGSALYAGYSGSRSKTRVAVKTNTRSLRRTGKVAQRRIQSDRPHKRLVKTARRGPNIIKGRPGVRDTRRGYKDKRIISTRPSKKLHGGHGDKRIISTRPSKKLHGGHGDKRIISTRPSRKLRGGHGDKRIISTHPSKRHGSYDSRRSRSGKKSSIRGRSSHSRSRWSGSKSGRSGSSRSRSVNRSRPSRSSKARSSRSSGRSHSSGKGKRGHK